MFCQHTGTKQNFKAYNVEVNCHSNYYDDIMLMVTKSINSQYCFFLVLCLWQVICRYICVYIKSMISKKKWFIIFLAVSVQNKVLIHKVVFRPVHTNGIQLLPSATRTVRISSVFRTWGSKSGQRTVVRSQHCYTVWHSGDLSQRRYQEVHRKHPDSCKNPQISR